MVNVLAATVREVGSAPVEIRDRLLQQRPRSGRTGEILFGPDGARAGPVRIGLLRGGELVVEAPASGLVDGDRVVDRWPVDLRHW